MTESPLKSVDPSKLAIWRTLQNSASIAQAKHLRNYFLEDSSRHDNLAYSAAEITVDLSRNHLDKEIQSLLLSLAKQCELKEAIAALFTGKKINFTEDRPAVHTRERLPLDSQEIPTEVREVRKKIRAITEDIHCGRWLGYSGKAIVDIVNIGIGGSDLGPRMCATALSPYHNATVSSHFVANIDPSDLEQMLQHLNPETTLFIVASKSWSTLDTLSNAKNARQWIANAAGNVDDIGQHFIAVSSHPERCMQFGIDSDRILPMQEGVGGRYSLWSAVGLSIALATSANCFEELLTGAHQMDTHFSTATLEENLPLQLALLEIWYVNFWGVKSAATLPYNHDLRFFSDHLQQLSMESLGKSVDRDGLAIDYSTGPIIWGSEGTIGQHSFHQLLHQGAHFVPIDFILPLESHTDDQLTHRHLISNCLAQSEALMDGLSRDEAQQTLDNTEQSSIDTRQLSAHKAVAGNRPSTIISMKKLTPSTLGALIALYEHKVYCQSIIWNINAFDQWGVELGKVISTDIYSALSGEEASLTNTATIESIRQFKCQKK